MSAEQELTRVTVNLIPKAAESLDYLAEAERLSKTDVINRALQVYAFMARNFHEGKGLYVASANDIAAGHMEKIAIL